MAGVTSPRTGMEGRSDHQIAFSAATAGGGEMIVRGDHFDNDGDGLLNHWESRWCRHRPRRNFRPIPFHAGAMVDHKDLFLEVDWTNDRTANVSAPWSPVPGPGVTNQLVNMYANSPISNPDGTTGIKLHVDAGSGVDSLGNALSQNLPTAALQGGDVIGMPGSPSSPIDLVYFGEPGSLTAPGLVFAQLKRDQGGVLRHDR